MTKKDLEKKVEMLEARIKELERREMVVVAPYREIPDLSYPWLPNVTCEGTSY